MRAVVVDPPELSPAYDVVIGWNMVGCKSTATDVTTKDYPAGAEYVSIYGFRNGAWFLIPGPDYDDPKVKPGLGHWVSFAEPGTIYP